MTRTRSRRTALPNRPDATEAPVFRQHQVTPNQLPPGPGRRYDRRHFDRMSIETTIVLWLLGAVLLSFFLTELGVIPDVFGWYSAKG